MNFGRRNPVGARKCGCEQGFTECVCVWGLGGEVARPLKQHRACALVRVPVLCFNCDSEIGVRNTDHQSQTPAVFPASLDLHTPRLLGYIGPIKASRVETMTALCLTSLSSTAAPSIC